MTHQNQAYVVVDTWRVKPGKEQAIKRVLAQAYREFIAQPEILSVDYCLVDEDPGRYLVVFRYSSQDARERFVATDELTSTMETLRDYWDLDDVYVKGPAADLE
jgi:quinol monooxygenase YgiN